MKTIVALSTFPANCAIHIIRVSGDKSYEIVNKILKNKIIKKGYSVEKNTIVNNNEIIDEVILVKFVAPKSFSGENLIEINCHGGIFLANKIIELLIKNGATLAQKGEFSKRAFLNNKINLLQANAINNLINSNSEVGLKVANNGFSGEVKKIFANIKDELFDLIGKIEINIDYPEYKDSEKITYKKINILLPKIIKTLEEIINNTNKITPILNGIKVAIIGKPNVGKSSLLNCLIKQDRAIISNVSGTTRDIISEETYINGVRVKFLDTAGIRKGISSIEKIGINKTLNLINEANLILFVYDCSTKIDNEEKKILELLKNKKYILVANKSDKNTKYILKNSIEISAKNKQIDKLIKKLNSEIINTQYDYKKVFLQTDEEVLFAQECVLILKNTLKGKNVSLDLLINDLYNAHKKIMKILGDNDDLDYINEMFKKFCIGK